MKTPVLYILLFLSISVNSFAQNYQSVEEINDACAQLGFKGNEEAETAVDNILTHVGLKRNFIIQECPEINNAVAKNVDLGTGKKQRYILYDGAFFERIENKAANDWAAISILAHEIGHHLNGHALNDKGSTHKWELEADEFSGFILGRMGSTLKEAQSAIATLKYEKATSTHPAKADRLKAIEKGWNRGTPNWEDNTVVTEEEEEIIEDNYPVPVIPVKAPRSNKEYRQKAYEVVARHLNAIGGELRIKDIKKLQTEAVSIVTNYENNDVTKDTMKLVSYQLSPNKILTQVKSKGKESYGLQLMENSYTKDNSTQNWTFKEEDKNFEKKLHLIDQYDLLFKEKKLIYIARLQDHTYTDYFDIVELPQTEIKEKTKDYKSVTRTKIQHWYNSETGILDHSIIEIKVEVDMKGSKIDDAEKLYRYYTYYSDYRRVNGVLFPFEIKFENSDHNLPTVMTYSKIIANPDLDASKFKVD